MIKFITKENLQHGVLGDIYLLEPITTTERNSLTPQQGWIINNSTTGRYEEYKGSEWKPFSVSSLFSENQNFIIPNKPISENGSQESTYTRLQDFGNGFTKTGRGIEVEEVVLNPDHFSFVDGQLSLSQSILNAINSGGSTPSQLEFILPVSQTSSFNSSANAQQNLFDFTGVQSGDIMMVGYYINNGTPPPTPSGWSLSHSTLDIRIYTKVYVSGSPEEVFLLVSGESLKPHQGWIIRGGNSSNITYGAAQFSDYEGDLTLPSLSSPGTKSAIAIVFSGSTDNDTADHAILSGGFIQQIRRTISGFVAASALATKELPEGGGTGQVTIKNTNPASKLQALIIIIESI